MTYHRLISPSYFDDITHPSLRWVQDDAASTGKHAGAIRMADDLESEVPAAQMIMLRPGAIVPRHAHDCHVVQVVVIGSLDVGEGDPLTEGDVIVTQPGEYSGPRVAGSGGALLATFYADVNSPV